MVATPFTETLRQSSDVVGRFAAATVGGAGRFLGRPFAGMRAGRPPSGEPPREPGRRGFHLHPILLIAAATALLVTVLIGSRCIFLAELRSDVMRDAQGNLVRESAALAEQADGSFTALDLVLSSVGDAVDRARANDAASYARMMSGRETHAMLAEKIIGLPFVAALSLVDASGRLVNSSRGWPVPTVNVAGRDYFTALKGDAGLHGFIGKPMPNRIDGDWNIDLARRLNDPNGGFIGVVVGALRVQLLEKMFRSTLPADGTRVSLLRRDGMLLAGAPGVQGLGTFPMLAASGAGRRSELTAAHPLANYPLLVVASRGSESALQGWRSLAGEMALATTGTIIILLATAAVTARWRSQQAKLVRATLEKAEAEAERTKARHEIEMLAAHEVDLAAERAKLCELNAELTISRDRAEEANAKLRQAEAELQSKARALEEHAAELKRSNAELEQFAYIASHDLQEPLRSVSSYCQLLKRRYGDKLDQDAGEFLGFAVDGAQRMQQLIKDLLAYSRVGRAGGAFEPLDMNDVVATALANLSGAIADSGARIERGELPCVAGQRVQLAQLFQNLIGNAIKFRRGEPPVIRIGASDAGDGLARFTVEDNGIGIPREHLERAFVIFQRLHDREKYAGTGIGLAIVKKVVEHHGGRVWIESTPGEGSRFHFTLPLVRDATEPSIASAA